MEAIIEIFERLWIDRQWYTDKRPADKDIAKEWFLKGVKVGEITHPRKQTNTGSNCETLIFEGEKYKFK